jgi:hypothetical protein
MMMKMMMMMMMMMTPAERRDNPLERNKKGRKKTGKWEQRSKTQKERKEALASVLSEAFSDLILRFLYEGHQKIKQNHIGCHVMEKETSKRCGIYRSYKSDSPSTTAM